jgi:hypothetical protein
VAFNQHGSAKTLRCAHLPQLGQPAPFQRASIKNRVVARSKATKQSSLFNADSPETKGGRLVAGCSPRHFDCDDIIKTSSENSFSQIIICLGKKPNHQVNSCLLSLDKEANQPH